MDMEAWKRHDFESRVAEPHPAGWLCRCGLPSSCVCPSDFPDNVIEDLSARVGELDAEVQRLRDGIHEHRECRSWEPNDDNLRLWSLIDEEE